MILNVVRFFNSLYQVSLFQNSNPHLSDVCATAFPTGLTNLTHGPSSAFDVYIR